LFFDFGIKISLGFGFLVTIKRLWLLNAPLVVLVCESFCDVMLIWW
jgi:hypothetical protein